MEVLVDEVVEVAVWIEEAEEVAVDLTEVVEVVVLPWVVTGMDHLQSEVEWFHHKGDQWLKEVDSRDLKEQMVMLLIHQANIRVARMRHVE